MTNNEFSTEKFTGGTTLTQAAAAAKLLRTTQAAALSAPGSAPVHPGVDDVVSFWTAAGPALWFAKDAVFDALFRDQFIVLHEAAAQGALSGWAASPRGALALLILLDQFPRNAFRGTPRAYATDPLGLATARAALADGHDAAVEPTLALFFYLPFAHSENLSDQERSVALARDLPPPIPEHAARHCDIIRRFGRFPHRNAVLGRTTTPDEAAYLASGGFAG